MKSRRVSKPKFNPPSVLLIPSNPIDLQQKVQQVQLAIARRAHNLYEARGREHGHDLEDWFRAESELLGPVSVSMSESEERISVRANVGGFDETELEINIEPSRITIVGKKRTRETKVKGGPFKPTGSQPDQILQVVDLATEVVPERSVVELRAGVLKFELPTAAKKIDTAA